MLYICEQKSIIKMVSDVFFIIIIFQIDGPIHIAHFTTTQDR